MSTLPPARPSPLDTRLSTVSLALWILTALILLLSCAVPAAWSQNATVVNHLPRTTTMAPTNILIVLVSPNNTNGLQTITASNLLEALKLFPNWEAASVTNAVSVVRLDGVGVASAATAIDFITGSNTVVRATNAAGVVTVQINAAATPGGGNFILTLDGLGTNTFLTNAHLVKAALSNGVAVGASFVVSAPQTNSGQFIKLRGHIDPFLEITSITLPQTFYANSQGIGTRTGGGQDYLLFSPEETATLEIATDSLRPVNGHTVGVGTVLRPFSYAYFARFVSASNYFLGPFVQFIHGADSPESVVTAGPQSLYFQTNQTSGIGLWIKTNGFGNSGWWPLTPGAGGGGVSVSDLNSASNALYAIETTRNAAVSNAVQSSIMTASNNLYTAETTRNAAVSNAVIAEVITASNNVYTAETTRNAAVSNAVQSSIMTASNNLYTTETTRNAAVSNALVSLLVANDTTTSNALYNLIGGGISFAAIPTSGLVGGGTYGWFTNLSANLLIVPTNFTTDRFYYIMSRSAGYVAALSNASAINWMQEGRGGITQLGTNGQSTVMLWKDGVSGETNGIHFGPQFDFQADGNCLQFITNHLTKVVTLTNTCTGTALDPVLSNLVATVARNVTNVVSLSTSNSTSKPLTNSYTAGVLSLFGLEAGANVSITPNGSNLVLAASSSTVNGNLDTALITNSLEFIRKTVSLGADTNAIVNLASGDHFVLIAVTNFHLVFTNAPTNGFSKRLIVQQDTNGMRSMLSYRVVGGLVEAEGTLALTTNANARDEFTIKSTTFSTNVAFTMGPTPGITNLQSTAVELASSLKVSGDQTNAGSALKLRGNNNPVLEVTSITLPQTSFLDSQGLGTRSGGGQPYLVFRPEETASVEITVTNIRPVNGVILGLGEPGRPIESGDINRITIKSGRSTSNAVVGGLTYMDLSSRTNHSTANNYTNLSTLTVAANTLTNNGDTVIGEWSGTMLSGTNRFVLGYGSITNILDLSGLTNGHALASWSAELRVTRTGNTGQRIMAKWETAPGFGIPFFTTNRAIDIAETNGIANLMRLQGSCIRAGGITNDYFAVEFKPASR